MRFWHTIVLCCALAECGSINAGDRISFPLANWAVQDTRVDLHSYRITLRMRGLNTGGDGEALEVLRRHAQQLARVGGYAGYEVVEFSESIDSTIPFAQRLAQGLVRLHH